MESYFSFSEPLNSGIDFYRADDYVNIDASINVTSNVSINFVKTIYTLHITEHKTSAVIFIYYVQQIESYPYLGW